MLGYERVVAPCAMCKNQSSSAKKCSEVFSLRFSVFYEEIKKALVRSEMYLSFLRNNFNYVAVTSFILIYNSMPLNHDSAQDSSSSSDKHTSVYHPWKDHSHSQ